MKKLLLMFCLISFVKFTAFAQLNMSLVGSLSYDVDLSNIWGYAAPDGTEYALVGTYEGVSIVSLADPANPVETVLVPGPLSDWREVKTWSHYAYATNEEGGGLLVIDLANLPNANVEYQYWAPNIPGLGALNTIHSLFVDDLGYLYLNGSNLNSGGLLFVDLNTDPYNPTYVGKGPAVYAHDSFGRNNIAYSFEINEGDFKVLDVSDKSNPMVLGTQETAGNFTHNGWLSDDSKILFTTDEVGNAPVGAYDVTDPTDIIELDQFYALGTLGTGVIPHNAHVWNDYVIVSYYTDGCIILDGSKPDNLIEIANFDTYIPPTTGFAGAWGAYPYLPSGLVLVSDIGDGLFVLQPDYKRACYLEGKITDAVTNAGLGGATIEILGGQLAFTQSRLVGDYKTGLANAGTYEVLVKKPGYESQTISVNMENGEVTMLDVALQPLPSFVLNGKVVDAASGAPVANAKVKLYNPDFDFDLTTDGNGNFAVQQFYNGDYDVFAGKWGYKVTIRTAEEIDQSNGSLTLELVKGYEDIFSLDLGWTVDGDAPQGTWERGTPIEVMPAQVPYPIQTGSDEVADAGNACYVTGNTADLFSGVQITGTTSLTSPSMDLTEMNAPHLKFSSWLFSVNTASLDIGNDKILVKLSNGTQTVVVKEIIFASLFFPPAWTPSDIDISSLMPITNNMKVIFEIGDIDPTNSDAAEAGIDFFQIYDANPTSGTEEPNQNGISMAVFPNPTQEVFGLDYDILDWKGDAKLLVYNALGQEVEQYQLESQSGRLAVGKSLNDGLYFANIVNNGTTGQPIKLVKYQ